MLAKKRKVQAPTSVMDEAPALGAFPGVFLTAVVVLVAVAAAALVVAAAAAVAALLAGVTAAVLFCPKIPVCICKRSVVLSRTRIS